MSSMGNRMDLSIWAAKFFGSAFGVLLSMLFVAPTNNRNALYRILFAPIAGMICAPAVQNAVWFLRGEGLEHHMAAGCAWPPAGSSWNSSPDDELRNGWAASGDLTQGQKAASSQRLPLRFGRRGVFHSRDRGWRSGRASRKATKGGADSPRRGRSGGLSRKSACHRGWANTFVDRPGREAGPSEA